MEAYYPVLLGAMDLEAREKARVRRHVFLARYGKQSMLQWADVDGRVVRAYAAALAEMLQEEEDAVKRAASAAALKG